MLSDQQMALRFQDYECEMDNWPWSSGHCDTWRAVVNPCVQLRIMMNTSSKEENKGTVRVQRIFQPCA